MSPVGEQQKGGAANASASVSSVRAAARATRRTAAVCGAFLALVAAWALMPLPELPTELAATPQGPLEPVSAAAPPGLDVAAFATPLWTLRQPAAPPPEPAPPPPPPLRLQLLAITRGDAEGSAGLQAIFFDPESSKVVAAATGDRIAGRTVAAVDQDGVRFTIGKQSQHLKLRPTDGTGEGR